MHSHKAYRLERLTRGASPIAEDEHPGPIIPVSRSEPRLELKASRTKDTAVRDGSMQPPSACTSCNV